MAKSADQELAISAQNIFTPSILLEKRERLSVSVSGTFDATITLQRQLDAVNWRDIMSWSGAVELSYIGDEGQDIRIGIRTGDYVSGTALCRIGKG